MLRPRFLLILIASTIFTAAICGFVFWVLAKSEDIGPRGLHAVRGARW